MGVVLLSRRQIGQTEGTEQQMMLVFLSQCWKHFKFGQEGRELDEDCIVLHTFRSAFKMTCTHQDLSLDPVEEEL